MQKDYNLMGEVFFALCKSVDTPISLGAWLRFKHGEHAQLASMELKPSWYCNPQSFRDDYLCVEYLSKYKGLNTGIDTRAVALQKFKASEVSCRASNLRLKGPSAPDPIFGTGVESIMFMAQRKIAKVLGPLNDAWLEYCKWGPGVTFSLKGEASLVDKICEDRFSCTRTAIPYFQRAISNDFHWLRSRGIEAEGPVCLMPSEFQVVRGNRVTFVPKNAKTDRTIAIEPTCNIFLQLGVGSFMRRRLRRIGIDLDDQSRNQSGAREALTRGLATVDLEAASDSVSRELVFSLLPLDWAMLLDDLRSPSYYLEGEWHKSEKFSAMGCGFTFELETLIFWALASSAQEFSRIHASLLVYGDDIIVHEDVLALLQAVLLHCGFRVNTRKTHGKESQFRESCGVHFFMACDVTPIYQKEVPDVLEEIYRAANRLRRLAFSRLHYIGCDARLRGAWHVIARHLSRPRHFSMLGSQEDGGLMLTLSEILAFYTPRFQNWGSFKLPVLSFVPSRKVSKHEALLAYTLRFRPTEPFDGTVILRRRGRYVTRYRTFLSYVYDCPWV